MNLVQGVDEAIGLPTPTAYAQTAARTVSVGFVDQVACLL